MSDIERKTAGDRLGWALSVLDESAAPVGRRLVARQTLREIAAEADQLAGAVEDQRAMVAVADAVASLRAGKISAMSAWQAVVDAVDHRAGGQS